MWPIAPPIFTHMKVKYCLHAKRHFYPLAKINKDNNKFYSMNSKEQQRMRNFNLRKQDYWILEIVWAFVRIRKKFAVSENRKANWKERKNLKISKSSQIF